MHVPAKIDVRVNKKLKSKVDELEEIYVLGIKLFKFVSRRMFIKGRRISILVDSGCTHSFTDERLAKELNYTIEKTKIMTVRVANGEKLESKALIQPLI